MQSAPFHHVLGSVHPQLEEYKAQYFTGDALAFQRIYFEHLAQAAETGLYDTLSHPDLVKNFTASQWGFKRVLPDIQRALDRIAATGVAMEINTSGLLKTIPEMNPGPAMLLEMQQRDIPVVIGADAHKPERVADKYEMALDLLEQAGYDEINFFLERRRQTVPLSVARQSLRAL